MCPAYSLAVNCLSCFESEIDWSCFNVCKRGRSVLLPGNSINWLQLLWKNFAFPFYRYENFAFSSEVNFFHLHLEYRNLSKNVMYIGWSTCIFANNCVHISGHIKKLKIKCCPWGVKTVNSENKFVFSTA